jgi:2-methylcitrate dehydratase PrpD
MRPDDDGRSMTSESVTARLAARARGLAFDDLPDAIVLAAKTCLLDWTGCALAGAREPLVEILASDAGGAGPSTLLGRGATSSASVAALINGAAGHALDYDDTHLHMSGHPTAPVAPAVVALAEARGAHGRDLLAAFVAGVETECRLGAVMGAGHYSVGWHATGTMGTFGAAAACAHLLHLDEEQTLHAFGLAGTQAAGLKSVFGSMAKPLHAGKAAANGLFAAAIAARGFTSNTDIVDTHQGFAATHTSTFTPDALDHLEGRWLIAETLFKYHASCYLTHSAMEAAGTLKVDPDDVASVTIVVPPGHLDVCGIPEPRSGLEGKFSLRATVAMTLLGDDTADPDTFTDARVTSSEVVALRDRITVRPSTDMFGTQSRIDIRTTDGRDLSETADVGTPASDLGQQWQRLTAKFIRLAAPILGEDRAWTVHDRISRLDELDDASTLFA